jgi:hypothetical protein
MRRTYILDGVEISSHDVMGSLHKARKDLYECLICSKQILKGQEYITLLVIGSPYFHKDCYLEDHRDEKVIIAVGVRKVRKLGIVRTTVLCKVFEKEQVK